MDNIPAIYILATGLMANIIIFLLMVQANKLLKVANPNLPFTAYNNKRLNARAIIAFWTSDTAITTLVKKMLLLDYALMIAYTSTIIFGLMYCLKSAEGFWKLLYAVGIILVAVGTLLDAWQDRALYQHLTRNVFNDFRWLTKIKKGCIVLSILTLVPGIVKNWELFIA